MSFASLRSLRQIRSFNTSSKVIEQTNKFFVPVYAKQKAVFSHGQGCYLFDCEGRKYLDLSSGIAVNCLGYGDLQLADAIYNQSKKLIHVSNLFHNIPAAELAERLVKLSFADRAFLCNSGTEANEGALKFARKYGKKSDPSKVGFISFEGAFHGRSMGSLSVTPNEKYKKPFQPLLADVVHLPFNDFDAAAKAIGEKTCGVIIEPIQGESGINPAKKEFLHHLRQLCDKNDALLIFDEIQCGLARTGKLWAHEHFGVTPDIMTLAKALGNGFPIGAILINQKVTKVLDYGDHGSTFAGQPLASVAANTVLDRITKPEFLKHVTDIGNYFMESLRKINSPFIKEVRGYGLMIGVEIDLEKCKIQTLDPIVECARNKGVILITGGKNVLRLVPPLIITKQEVDEAVSVISSCLKEL